MDNHHELGKFCSVAKQGTIIFPKKIQGYKEPEGQILKENGQKIDFVYTPIEYDISYDFGGGKPQTELKEKYTIEDPTYVPYPPVREGYHFNGWEPKSIPHGSIGNIRMIATWMANPTLITGRKLNSALTKLAGSKSGITSIVIVDHKLNYPNCNISSTSTPINAYYLEGVVYLYAKYPIWCNKNMDHAFEGFELLRDIKCFKDIHCAPGTSIKYLFSGCTVLSRVDSVNNWADGEFNSFIGAFNGTAAANSSRVPVWYRCVRNIIHKSTSGKILKSTVENKIPGELIYGKSFVGYESNSNPIAVGENSDIIFEYSPMKYSIKYILNGGELLNAKTTYTIEDETYYPPEPVKFGYVFTGWDRKCIEEGNSGNIVFIAQYKMK